MPNEVHQQLYRATFRGVPFMFTSSQRKGGRKTAVHEYPGADRRFVEDLGKTVPTFTMDITITGKEDYFTKRDRFIKALEDSGSGILSHPFFGDMTVSVIEYTLDEDMSKLGAAKFSVNFAITSEEIYPQQLLAGSASVNAKAAALTQTIKTYIKNTYAPPRTNKFVQQYNSTIFYNLVNQMRSAITRIQQQVQTTKPDISEANEQLNYMQANRSTILDDSEVLGDNLEDGFNQIDEIDVDASVSYTAFYATFYFNQSESAPAATTIQQVQCGEYFKLLTGVFNMLALVYAYQAASEMEYFTSDDVATVSSQLESQFKYILTFKNLDFSLLNELRDIRTEMREFFNDTGKNVYRVDTVTTADMPLSVLTYQYYGNVELVEELRQLNNIIEPAFVSGDVRILAQ